MLAILDYKAGNQTSVARALNFLKIPCKITDCRDEAAKARGIIFPGVGAAGQAMQNLEKTGMDKVLKESILRGTPVLGICLGCQIMLDMSEENSTQTLGIVPGKCLAFDPAWKEEDGESIRIPHMGWNSLHIQNSGRLFKGIPENTYVYFVHSYYLQAEEEEIVKATTQYSTCIHASVEKGNVFACQFHPEKSSRWGLKILENFAALESGTGKEA